MRSSSAPAVPVDHATGMVMTGSVVPPEEIVSLAERSARVDAACECAKRLYPGWDSLSSTFPDDLLDCVGRVSGQDEGDLTVQEYHPAGTSYWSPAAPIALHYFPANRSTVWQCRACQRAYLRYTEFGGYYVDRRIRALQPELITLEAGPAAAA